MFGLFLAGACVTFVMIFIVPLAIYSRWASLPITILTFLAALFTTVRLPLPPSFPPTLTHSRSPQSSQQ